MPERFRGGFDYKGLAGCYYQEDGSRLIRLYDFAPERDGSHITGEILIPAEDQRELGLIFDELGREQVPVYVGGKNDHSAGQPLLL